jgi:hypothetical protein
MKIMAICVTVILSALLSTSFCNSAESTNDQREHSIKPLFHIASAKPANAGWTTPLRSRPIDPVSAGRQGYRRSCVTCHGIEPEGLAHHDAERFRQSVLDGTGAMPGLAFKLDAAEVEHMRQYISYCARDFAVC